MTKIPQAIARTAQSAVRRRLLAWFRCHARDLPWRRTRDPYAIWVSEVMLQQTQVATVIPYFARFIARFPTLAELARAGEAEVLNAWQGLGYYRRARDLHRAAQILAEQGDSLPNDPDLLRALPSFGRYTVNAVLSQAFDRRLPIIEANSQRVLCRFLAVREDPRSGPVQRRLWQAAESLVPNKDAGAFNQALMELGALVCTPVDPKCGACPIARHCAAHDRGLEDRIPMAPPKKRLEYISEVALVARRNGRVLFVQRPAAAERWANFWEMPHAQLQTGETHKEAARRLLKSLGLRARLGEVVTTIRHTVTRYRIDMVCLEACCQAGRFRSEFHARGAWLSGPELDQIPLSSPQRRLAKFAFAEATKRR